MLYPPSVLTCLVAPISQSPAEEAWPTHIPQGYFLFWEDNEYHRGCHTLLNALPMSNEWFVISLADGSPARDWHSVASMQSPFVLDDMANQVWLIDIASSSDKHWGVELVSEEIRRWLTERHEAWIPTAIVFDGRVWQATRGSGDTDLVRWLYQLIGDAGGGLYLGTDHAAECSGAGGYPSDGANDVLKALGRYPRLLGSALLFRGKVESNASLRSAASETSFPCHEVEATLLDRAAGASTSLSPVDVSHEVLPIALYSTDASGLCGVHFGNAGISAILPPRCMVSLSVHEGKVSLKADIVVVNRDKCHGKQIRTRRVRLFAILSGQAPSVSDKPQVHEKPVDPKGTPHDDIAGFPIWPQGRIVDCGNVEVKWNGQDGWIGRATWNQGDLEPILALVRQIAGTGEGDMNEDELLRDRVVFQAFVEPLDGDDPGWQRGDGVRIWEPSSIACTRADDDEEP